MTQKILVTGVAGYIGSVLAPMLLERGHEVIGVDNFIYDNQQAVLGLLGHPRFRLLVSDTRLFSNYEDVLRTADVIIPLAAIVGAPACDRNPGMARDINFYYIYDMMAKLSPYQRVIFPNTNSGYGSTDGIAECTEDSPLDPVSLYGRDKCLAENAVLRHPNSATLRLATVFGASPRMRMDLMVNDFTERLMRQRHLSIFEPHFARNFVHVRDVARVFIRMVDDHRLRGPFNVGNPACNMTKMELAHQICDSLLMNRSCVTEGAGRDPDQRNYRVSNKKLLDTGFTFQNGLVKGVAEVANVCRLFTAEQTGKMRNT